MLQLPPDNMHSAHQAIRSALRLIACPTGHRCTLRQRLPLLVRPCRDYVALRVEDVIVQRIIVLHRQRLVVLVVDEVDGLAAARLTGHEAAEGREIIRRRAHGLAAANAGHIIGIAYVRAADLGRCQSAPLRPRERAAVVILRRISAGVGDGIAAIRRQQVAPRAVAVGR